MQILLQYTNYTALTTPTTLHNTTQHYTTLHTVHYTNYTTTITTTTSSTAQGGGGSFKNRKHIGEVGCCESRMAERIH